ncbi:TerC family protein [Vibrio harveyi]|uniref:TerC family protein n=1 Tax=Vibrio harveyi TaxID=669 RepID=UPI00165D5D09|nr:TerC family protein [Vibrio harveyi]WJT10578.1 TerC family protein [Vibrio harveyi]HDM8061322.1 TerC family protein [Vibrio harveyi]HDM8072240.1 TerC family protein [Vibrio harveyi]
MNLDYFIAFGTLLMLEIILGVDNIVFITIMTERLPAHLRQRVRNLGIGLAVLNRIALVFSVSWLLSWKEPFVEYQGVSLSCNDLIFIVGGAFLLFKGIKELWAWVVPIETPPHQFFAGQVGTVILQIIAVDAVFSLDSLIIAASLTQDITILAGVIISSSVILMLMANKVQAVITRHPGLKVLALLFLIVLGALLIVEGVGLNIDKHYVYSALAFGLLLELCHILISRQPSSRRVAGQYF